MGWYTASFCHKSCLNIIFAVVSRLKVIHINMNCFNIFNASHMFKQFVLLWLDIPYCKPRSKLNATIIFSLIFRVTFIWCQGKKATEFWLSWLAKYTQTHLWHCFQDIFSVERTWAYGGISETAIGLLKYKQTMMQGFYQQTVSHDKSLAIPSDSEFWTFGNMGIWNMWVNICIFHFISYNSRIHLWLHKCVCLCSQTKCEDKMPDAFV